MRLVDQKFEMALKTFVGLATALGLCACSKPSPPLPPLLEGATTTGGTTELCGQGRGQGSTPETASHSPEIVQRLRHDFPAGTSASRLRTALERQGFSIHDACSPDKMVSWAEFRERGGNGITAMAAYGTVYWREDAAGRIVWTTGDIAFAGL
jgi:hypothetical protein